MKTEELRVTERTRQQRRSRTAGSPERPGQQRRARGARGASPPARSGEYPRASIFAPRCSFGFGPAWLAWVIIARFHRAEVTEGLAVRDRRVVGGPDRAERLQVQAPSGEGAAGGSCVYVP